ncbi:syntenin-1-like [Sycon ciliatum]|uniref:syntenin-1-like n=1 Tax=Sycon ciliatum TaxID=27933 RepID=UPI0020A91588|eukprot:scpid78264/ scgid28629/ Syntenin-1; Scaffold protein Pbp1; Syndecan-binding protein 1
MSMYPSLEDMTVDKMARAQVTNSQPAAAAPVAMAVSAPTAVVTEITYPTLYPSLGDMGLELPAAVVEDHMRAVAQYAPQGQAVAVPAQPSPGNQLATMVAPVTGNREVGLMRSEIKQGIREIVLCKDTKGKCGLAVKAISKGVFVAFVYRDSPAKMAGLRFGDQVLQINGETVAGYTTDKATKILAKAAPERIVIAVRDRPFERTITMQKDSANHVGFVYKKGKIEKIVKDSSAARNGILTDHYLVEVNGQNVVGLSDSDIEKVFVAAPRTTTITLMPHFVYDHIIKNIGSLKKYMDHSVPEC